MRLHCGLCVFQCSFWQAARYCGAAWESEHAFISDEREV
jgi:hypothetical protein